MQNCYPIAIEPLDMRNERGFDGLGRVGGLGRKTSVWATRPAGSPGKGWALRPARSACKLAFATRILINHTPCTTPRSSQAAPGPARPGWAVEPCEVALGCGLRRRACGAIWVGQGDPGGVSALLRAFYSLCCA